MRTTLTLDDDVAVLLEKYQVANKISFKEAVNRALRDGLVHLQTEPSTRTPFRTTPADLGPSLIGSLDNVAEVLAVGEGESYR